MNPESVKKIMDMPEGRELFEYFCDEANKLNSVEAVPKFEGMYGFAIKTTGNSIAFKILKDIIGVLGNVPNKPKPINPKEYTVDL